LDGGDDARVLSGDALLESTAAVAAALQQLGVSRGDRVLWGCAPGLDAIVALLGALRAGAVVVPINPAFTVAELAHVTADATPAVAIVEREEHQSWLKRHAPAARVRQPAALAAEGRTTWPVTLDAAAPEDDALIVYTSGTTGRPKGAVHTHRSLLTGVQALRLAWGWQPDDRLVLTLPLFHVHGLCAGLFGTLTAGATAVVFERFSEEAVFDAAADASMFFGVPTMYHRLAASDRASELARLRLCVSGSAALSADLWQIFADQGVPILERYGMSETLLTLSNPLDGPRHAGTVGTALPGVSAAVHDPDEHGVGELLVQGLSLCRGYWGLPEATAAMRVGGWFRTGDLAALDKAGYVSIRGRQTELIITGGHNVYPAEVEAVLAQHPSVHEIAVVGEASTEWGEAVVAYVVGAGGPPDLGALHALCVEQLAPFKHPRQFRVLNALPRNAMGKVLRRELGSD
jgi:malonyl-CoA/methylmalonyl-CoA synthetase